MSCTGLGRGRDPNAMVSGIQTAWPNLTQQQSQMLISVSVGNFCPKVLPKPLPWSPQHQARYLVNVGNNEDKPTTRTSDEHHHPCKVASHFRCKCGLM